MQTYKPVFYTAAELFARGNNDIPRELVSTTHLIYSSPATLAFNSPGAEGYGVKRAGLAVPGSVMLIVSPGCCGRNTSAISRMPGYEDRFFYLTMNETDLVTGRHLKKIPRAVAEICRGLEIKGKRPRVVMICITCVDALLGTDMERICRRAQEKVPGLRVQPCYMYALTREGRKPPMVHVRQSIYELLEPRRKKSTSVNLLGFFAPLEENDLFDLLRQAGVRKIRQIGACPDYDAFQEMAEANFNIVLNPEARPAAYDLQERLGIPFIEMSRFYQIDRIEAQYTALGNVLQTKFDDAGFKSEALDAVEAFRRSFPDAVFSVGEAMNGNPFELACALVREGFGVREIFGTVNKDSYVWLGILSRISPETRIYSNLHPSMLHYDAKEAADSGVTISIGRDAGWYHPQVPNVQWITDVQPFGYRAVTGLFRALKEAMESGSRGSYSPDISLGAAKKTEKSEKTVAEIAENSGMIAENSGMIAENSGVIAGERTEISAKVSGEKTDISVKAAEENAAIPTAEELFSGTLPPGGFRRFTTPFAPDQSGAVSVLYDMGGICVICDAGGCTGNICGFDEPRWFGNQSAVFSAGLRDMDAILGRDDRLVEKLADAAQQIPASFAAIVGTPVPAVIGTDYRALCRMAAKKTGLPVIGVNTDGMEYYDRGLEKTYLALVKAFCSKKARTKEESAADRESAPVPDAVVSPADPAVADSQEVTGRADASDANAGIADASCEDAGRAVAGRAATPDVAGIQKENASSRIVGIWGYSPLDFQGILSENELRAWAAGQGYDGMICCGAGARAEDLPGLAKAQKNIVLSPAGAEAAKWLEKTYGTPWEYCIPDSEKILQRAADGMPAGKTLVVHQQVLADALCSILRGQGMQADTAGFFMMLPALQKENDVRMREETDLRSIVQEGHYDNVIADRSLEPVLAGLPVRLWHLPHFAVSGEQSAQQS